MRDYWKTPSLGGGPLTGNLSTSRVSSIRTPLVKSIEKTSTYGYFKIYMIRASNYLSGTYYDAWILTTRPEDVLQLTNLSKQTKIKCCMFFDEMKIG